MTHSAAKLGILLLAIASFGLAGATHATTLLTISGSGDLTIEADGDIYVDFSLVSLTNLHLTADSGIALSASFPATVPTIFDATAAHTDLLGVHGFDFSLADGDILFDSLVWTGTVTMHAADIYAIGDLSGISALVVGGGLPPNPDGCPPGSAPAGGAVITSGGGSPDVSLCVPVISPSPGGIVLGPGGLDPIFVAVVPEPSAPLLFATGVAILLMRRRP